MHTRTNLNSSIFLPVVVLVNKKHVYVVSDFFLLLFTITIGLTSCGKINRNSKLIKYELPKRFL